MLPELNWKDTTVESSVPAAANLFGETGTSATQPSRFPSNLFAKITDLPGGVSTASIPADGVTDAVPALQALINTISAGGGGRLFLPYRYLIDTALTVPKNVFLVGPWDGPPDESLPAASHDYNSRNGQLIINSAVTITLNNCAGIKGFLAMRKGLTLPFASAAEAQTGVAAFAGTAFTYGSAGCTMEDMLILGFEWAIVSISRERPYMRRVRGDCTNGIRVSNCFDIGRISQCHFWPYTTTHQSWTTTSVTSPDYGSAQAGVLLTRTGKGYVFDNVGDWNTISESFAYGYRIGYEVDGCDNCQLIACGADYYGPITGAVAIGFNVIGSTKDLALMNPQAAGQGRGVVVNSTTTKHAVRIQGGNFWDNDAKHIDVLNGRALILGNVFRGGIVGVDVDAASDGVDVISNQFYDVTTRSIGPDYATFVATGSTAIGNIRNNSPTNGIATVIDTTGAGTRFGGIVTSTAGDLAFRAFAANVVQLGNETNGISFRVATTAATTVNFMEARGAAAAGVPTIITGGTDTNINLGLTPKGTGRLRVSNANGLHLEVGSATTTVVNNLRIAGSDAGSNVGITAEGSDADISTNFTMKGTGRSRFLNGGGLHLEIGNGTASIVNRIRIYGNSASNRPAIEAEGSDTNIDINLLAKGTGRQLFANAGGTHFEVGGASSAVVNRVRIAGADTAVHPNIIAEGTDTNIDLGLTPKGTGLLRFGTRTASSDVAVTGYIEIKDSGGTIRRLAVVG
jgi:hypothetical protein